MALRDMIVQRTAFNHNQYMPLLYERSRMKPPTEILNFFVAILVRTEHKAASIYRLLVGAWGAANTPTERRIRQFVDEYRLGRESFARMKGSGAPSSVRDIQANIDQIKALIEENQQMSLRMLEATTGISDTSIERIIKTKLGLKSISARWVPYNISPDQKQVRLDG